MSKEQRILSWHFLPVDGKTKRLDTEVIPGRITKHVGEISICNSGLHASVNILDALGYASSGIVQRVEVWGNVQTQKDKVCGRYRKLLSES